MSTGIPTEDAAIRRRLEKFALFAGTSAREALSQLSQAKPGNIQEIAASQIKLLDSYYGAVLGQARSSFRAALYAAGVGLVFFVAALAFLLILRDGRDLAGVSVIAGTLVELIAGLNFVLYARTAAQLAHFHEALDRTQRLLLANSICEAISGELREKTRASLVFEIIRSGKSLPGGGEAGSPPFPPATAANAPASGERG